MAWTQPRTWVAGEMGTAALLNTHLRDNFNETGPAKVTTKGDILAATAASALARVAAGNNNGLLQADSAQSEGIAWGKKHLVAALSLTIGSSSNILGDAMGLNWAVGANEVWLFVAQLFYDVAVVDVGLKLGWTAPSGATMGWRIGDEDGGSAVVAAGGTDTAVAGPGGFDSLCVVWGYVETAGTAGTIQLQYAKDTNGGSGENVEILAFSALKAWQVG